MTMAEAFFFKKLKFWAAGMRQVNVHRIDTPGFPDFLVTGPTRYCWIEYKCRNNFSIATYKKAQPKQYRQFKDWPSIILLHQFPNQRGDCLGVLYTATKTLKLIHHQKGISKNLLEATIAGHTLGDVLRANVLIDSELKKFQKGKILRRRKNDG